MRDTPSESLEQANLNVAATTFKTIKFTLNIREK